MDTLNDPQWFKRPCAANVTAASLTAIPGVPLAVDGRGSLNGVPAAAAGLVQSLVVRWVDGDC